MKPEDMTREQLITLVNLLLAQKKQESPEKTQKPTSYQPTYGELKMAWRAKNGIG